MSIEDKKASLRLISKNDRMNISNAERNLAQQMISRYVIQYCLQWSEQNGHLTADGRFPLEDATLRSIALYAATLGEVALDFCFPLLLDIGWRIVFPKIDGANRMNMYQVGGLAELQPGSFQIPEPSSEAGFVCPEDVHVILVPGLAFTRDGRRLGYGGGYYDRYLTHCQPNCSIVGIAFERQVKDDLPVASHDVRMHALMTERGVVSCKTAQLLSF